MTNAVDSSKARDFCHYAHHPGSTCQAAAERRVREAARSSAPTEHEHRNPSPSQEVGAWCSEGCGQFVPLSRFPQEPSQFYSDGPKSYFVDARGYAGSDRCFHLAGHDSQGLCRDCGAQIEDEVAAEIHAAARSDATHDGFMYDCPRCSLTYGVCSAHRKPAPVDVSDNAWLKDRVEAEVETAAERIRAIPWCTPAMATNADHIARAVLETFFDTPTEAGHASPTAVCGLMDGDTRSVEDASAAPAETSAAPFNEGIMTYRGNRYGLRFMPTQPHVSLGLSVHLQGRFSHLSLHIPVGVLVLGLVGIDVVEQNLDPRGGN